MAYRKRIKDRNSVTSITSLSGISKELFVASVLAAQGYEIFLGLGNTSGVDFIAIRGDAVEYVEVKTAKLLNHDRLGYCGLKNNRPTLVALVTSDMRIYWLPR